MTSRSLSAVALSILPFLNTYYAWHRARKRRTNLHSFICIFRSSYVEHRYKCFKKISTNFWKKNCLLSPKLLENWAWSTCLTHIVLLGDKRHCICILSGMRAIFCTIATENKDFLRCLIMWNNIWGISVWIESTCSIIYHTVYF